MIGRILIVDDEPDILDALARLLEMKIKNVEIETACDGPEALALIQANEYDVIITDYRMPDMDGLELLTAAEPYLDGAKTVMATAFPDVDIAQSAINGRRVSAFVSKPFEPGELVNLIGRALWDRIQEGAQKRYIEETRDVLKQLRD